MKMQIEIENTKSDVLKLSLVPVANGVSLVGAKGVDRMELIKFTEDGIAVKNEAAFKFFNLTDAVL